MSKALLNINNFPTGIINNETLQTTEGFVDMSWIDMLSEPWIAQINKRLEQDTTTGMTETPLSAVTFWWKVLVWTENEEIRYENTANTWTLLHTNTNSWDINDLIVYQDYLIYASIDEIWRSTGTTTGGWFTDTPTWWSGTNAFDVWVSGSPHFFKILNNRLYISDGNLIAELDGASDPANPWNWVFTSDAFKLPEWENILSMETIGSYLAIWTESGNYYEWDGTSANSTTIVKTTIWGIHALIQIENTIFAFAWLEWVVYRYNGADFVPAIQISANRFNLSSTSKTRKPAVRRFRNGFIFWIPKNWIYVFDRVDSNSKWILYKYGHLSDGKIIDSEEWNIKMIYVTSATDDSFIVWYSYDWTDYIDSTSSSIRYRMFEAWVDDDTAAPYIETQVYELRDNKGKINRVQGLQAFFTGYWSDIENNLRVYYRLDNTEAYTFLGTIWEDGIDINKILRWISRRTNKVQFKIFIWAETTSDSLVRNSKITSFRIF